MVWTDYYVDAADGSDHPSADGTTVAAAFNTIQRAMDLIADSTIGNDSIIHIMDTGVYELNGHANNIDTGADWKGTFTGANSSGVVDGTRITIRATGTWSDATIGLVQSDHKYYTWMNIIFDANNLAEFAWNRGGNAGDSHSFINCRFTKALGWGCYPNNSYFQFYNCEFDNNGNADDDAHGGVYRTYYGHYYRCVFRDNLGIGSYNPGHRNSYDQCIFSNNSRYGLLLYGQSRVTDSLFEGNDRGAIYQHGSASYMPAHIINCVFRGNSNESSAIGTIYSGNDTYRSLIYNCIFDNQELNSQAANGVTAGATVAIAARFKYFTNTNTEGAVFYGGPTSDCGVTADDHFGTRNLTPRRDSVVVGAGVPLLYTIRGTTTGNAGIQYLADKETVSVF